MRPELPLPFDAARERFAVPRLRPLAEPLPFDELDLRLDDEPPLVFDAVDRLDEERPLALEPVDRLDDELPVALEPDDFRLDDELPVALEPDDFRLDEEPPLALEPEDLRLDDEPPLAFEDELRLLARDRDEDFLPPDDELDLEDLTLPSSISPRQAPVGSSSISMYAL